MEILEVQKGTKLILTIRGRLDANEGDLLQKRFKQIKIMTTDLTLDLSELKFLSSAGIRIIITIMKEMNAKKGTFTISKISPEVREIFNVVGLIDLFVQDEKYVIVVKEKSETKAVLTMSGNPDLKSGRDLSDHIKELQARGITEFVLDMTGIATTTPKFEEKLFEITREIEKKSKLTVLRPPPPPPIVPA
ncbi:STAS domain-containing protein [Treponema primitia]|uniref:STAS domain-containing protein n=1 Tax=Treponema primitia TaxID=88058 RepID=UPI0039805D5C